jgi:hypothetical protein
MSPQDVILWLEDEAVVDEEGDTDYAYERSAKLLAMAATVRALVEAVDALEPFADASRHLHPSQPDDATTLDGIAARHWRRAGRAFFDATGRQARDASEPAALGKEGV